MQRSLRRSPLARRVVAGLVVGLAVLTGASPARAQQSDDRPVVSRGRAIGMDRSKADEEKKAAEKPVAVPEGKQARDGQTIGGVRPMLVFTIDVRWLAASSYRIERDITSPIERALKSLPDVKSVRSTVTGSRAQTLVLFDAKEDASRQATAIRNRLDQIKSRLPRDASQPLIAWHRDPPS